MPFALKTVQSVVLRLLIERDAQGLQDLSQGVRLVEDQIGEQMPPPLKKHNHK